MNFNEIIKPAILGGVVIIVLELLVGIADPSIVYAFSIIALLVGGAIAGWMVKGKIEDGFIAGGTAGLVYGILGLLILYPLLSAHFRHSPAVYVVEIIVSIIVAGIGGFVGKYLASNQNSSKSARKRR
jgi:ABC-type phosphate transport system permease subunit